MVQGYHILAYSLYSFHIKFKYDLRIQVNRFSLFNYERQFYNFLYFINICNLSEIVENIIKLCYVFNMYSYPISLGHICFKMFVAQEF